MDRNKSLLKAFQRGHLLNLNNPIYKKSIERFMKNETESDLGEKGDITSNSIIKNNKKLKAIVRTREPGIVAGIEEVSFLYKKNNIKAVSKKKDGQRIKKGDAIFELYGNEKSLLKIERTAVDILQRMSGITTMTNKIIKSTKTKVASTRKTQWRYLDKKAVFIGKGLTHRIALWESILIKDNHLGALKRQGIKNYIETALERAWENKKDANFIEIEVTTEKEAIAASKKFKNLQKNSKIPCLIMLDNMTPNKCISTIKKLKHLKLHNHVLIEASGGITPKNLKNYDKTGVDVISMGFLTHSSHALDIKQLIR